MLAPESEFQLQAAAYSPCPSPPPQLQSLIPLRGQAPAWGHSRRCWPQLPPPPPPWASGLQQGAGGGPLPVGVGLALVELGAGVGVCSLEKGSSSLSPRHFLRERDAEGLGGGGLRLWGWTSSPAPGSAGYTWTSVSRHTHVTPAHLKRGACNRRKGIFNLVTSQSDLAHVSGCLALPLAILGSLRGLWPWPPGTLTHPGLWIPGEALDPGGRSGPQFPWSQNWIAQQLWEGAEFPVSILRSPGLCKPASESSFF